MKAGATNAAAFLWGLAEATFFFIVPDVLLTRLALGDPRRAAIACLWAMAGALLGGFGLWLAARQGWTPFLPAGFDRIPGISPALIAESAASLESQGPLALGHAVLSGRPYKLYAYQAGLLGWHPLAFLAASAAARLARFLATTALAWGIGRALGRCSGKFRLRLHLAAWVAFYAFYFTVMGTQ